MPKLALALAGAVLAALALGPPAASAASDAPPATGLEGSASSYRVSDRATSSASSAAENSTARGPQDGGRGGSRRPSPLLRLLTPGPTLARAPVPDRGVGSAVGRGTCANRGRVF